MARLVYRALSILCLIVGFGLCIITHTSNMAITPTTLTVGIMSPIFGVIFWFFFMLAANDAPRRNTRQDQDPAP